MEIFTIGGFSEVGKNMTAIKVGDEVGIIDMGLFLPKLLACQEEGDPRELGAKQLVKMGVIPDDKVVWKLKDKVKFITFGHGHLDHLGGAPYLAGAYDCPIVGTPYSLAILDSLIKDSKEKIKNPFSVMNVNSHRDFGNMKLEFLNMTHSIPQTVLIALHTKEGIFLYANDFKLDNHPIIGKKPSYERLQEIGKEGVKAMIIDSLYATRDMKTPSEQVAREMLRDVMLGTNNKDNAVVVTTFASHIARLKSIIHFSELLGRKVVLLGRSMYKYVNAAKDLGLIEIPKHVEVCGFSSKVKTILKDVENNRDKYVVVCTGNQGEPHSVLSRIARGELPFKFREGDHMVFSCKTIPTPETVKNREVLEKMLKQRGVRMFRDIHQSGHASRADLRDLIELVNPEHIIPAHGGEVGNGEMAHLAVELGYKLGKTVHLVKDGDVLKF